MKPTGYFQTYSNLHLICLDASGRSQTVGYWYLIQSDCTSHKAFRTRNGLVEWLADRGLVVDGVIPASGSTAVLKIQGEYRSKRCYRAADVEIFDAIPAGECIEARELDNARFMPAKITTDEDCVRTVWRLACDVRAELPYAKSLALTDS